MTIITRSKAKPPEVIKDASMSKQKEMMSGHYERLANAPERGDKVAATFVPGNLNELLMCFDFANTPIPPALITRDDACPWMKAGID